MQGIVVDSELCAVQMPCKCCSASYGSVHLVVSFLSGSQGCMSAPSAICRPSVVS